MITKIDEPQAQAKKVLVEPPERHQVATPQVSAKKKRHWSIKLLVVTGVVVGLYFAYPALAKIYDNYFAASKGDVAKNPVRIIPVVTAESRRGDMDLYITGLGTVTPLKTVTIRSRVEGELIKVLFKEGDTVKEGDLIAQIDSRPYKVLLDQASGQFAKDEATLNNAKKILERDYELIKSNAIAQQELDTQKSLVKELEATLATDQAKVDEASLNLQYCQITAPCSGRIGLRTVDQGNMVRANDPTGLAVITQTQPITVVFTIPQDSIVRVQRQLNTGKTMSVDAYDRGLKTKLAMGKFLAIDNQVDPGTGTVKIKASFENKENILFPNQFVNARLLLETRQNVVLIPAVAVQNGPENNFVYVVKNDKVELRNVTLGSTEDDLVIVESGLNDREIVVTDGVDKLQNGSKVLMRKTGAAQTPTTNDATAPAEANSAPKGKQ